MFTNLTQHLGSDECGRFICCYVTVFCLLVVLLITDHYSLQGYQTPLVENMDSLGVTDGDILALFNNIEEIKDFNEYVEIFVLC